MNGSPGGALVVPKSMGESVEERAHWIFLYRQNTPGALDDEARPKVKTNVARSLRAK